MDEANLETTDKVQDHASATVTRVLDIDGYLVGYQIIFDAITSDHIEMTALDELATEYLEEVANDIARAVHRDIDQEWM